MNEIGFGEALRAIEIERVREKWRHRACERRLCPGLASSSAAAAL